MKSIEFITDETWDLNNDVDMIYEAAFSIIVSRIHSGKWNGEEYAMRDFIGTTNILTSPDAIKANDMNSVSIITTQDNSYNPLGDAIRGPYISVSINHQVLDLIKEYGTIKEAITVIPWKQRERFMTEITPARIKGSIHHELSHWLDDTLHNSHIKNRLTQANIASEKHLDYKKAGHIMSQGKKARDLSNYEINAQIHAIKQLKRENEGMWDLLSFDEMIEMNASLIHLSDEFKKIDEYNNWKKQLLKRMHREKLLGDEMYRTL